MHTAPETWPTIQAKYNSNIPLSMLTAYDCPTARLADKAGVDILLVGDSVGTNVLGYSSVHEVTMDDICHHTRAVRRGTSKSYVLGDFPSGSYADSDTALKNAQRLVNAGADGVKLEGPATDVISALVSAGFQTCAHLGLTPQFHEKFRLKAANADEAKILLEQAWEVEKAGASMLVLELVPEEVAKIVTEQLSIPTIGIGAGRYTSGQVQVVHDLLGITSTTFRHAGRYGEAGSLTLEAIRSYRNDVEQKDFPTKSQARHIPSEELEHFIAVLGLK